MGKRGGCERVIGSAQGQIEEGEKKALNSIQLSWKSYILESKEI